MIERKGDPSASLALLESLTAADGVSGHEDEVRALFRDRLAPLGTLGLDRLGSVFCEKRGSDDAPRILIESHLDEVGFVVQRITPAGFVKFLPVGGWWPHVLPAQRVRIRTPLGKVPGIVAVRPPHTLKPAEREKVMDMGDLCIDVGARSDEEAAALGIAPGQPIAPHAPFEAMAGGRRFAAKAFDNRVGVALVIETLERLGAHPNTVIGAASAQEEVGMRGARTLAEQVAPDLALVLEGPYADDTPPGDPAAAQCRLGAGVHVRVYDTTMIPNPALCAFVIDAARAGGIPHQIAVWAAGGTDAAAIHLVRRGIPSIVLGVPARYIHSHASMIDLGDYEAALDLLLALIPALDASTVARICDGVTA